MAQNDKPTNGQNDIQLTHSTLFSLKSYLLSYSFRKTVFDSKSPFNTVSECRRGGQQTNTCKDIATYRLNCPRSWLSQDSQTNKQTVSASCTAKRAGLHIFRTAPTLSGRWQCGDSVALRPAARPQQLRDHPNLCSSSPTIGRATVAP